MKQKVWVIDIETLPNCFLVCAISLSGEKHDFTLWKNYNELDKLVYFLNECITKQDYHVTYNGLAFDSQILQWIIEYHGMFNLQFTDTIINELYKYAQECIKKSNYKQWQDYAPWALQIPQIDLYKMGHWDSDAKRASLKWLQCSIDWPNLKDNPYDHKHYIQNETELAELKAYCYNDCEATKAVLFKCKEAVDLRFDLTREYGIDLLSASEPRMSKELFLHFLSTKIGADKREMKKWSTLREDIKINDILLPYIQFQRQEFKMLLQNFKKLVVRGDALRGAFKYNVKYKGISIDYGMGGIHGMSDTGIYKSTDTHMIKSVDVSSFYPNECINNGWSPAHIPKKAFCEQYKWFYDERKKHKKGTAKNKALKLLLNSTFGLTIDKFSFLSDPQMGVQITVNGQLLLTMLLEMLCEGIPGAKPLVMNTDGIEILIHRDQEVLCEQICKEWEKMTMLQLEYVEYDTILAFDVNNYIAKEKNGKLKGKGRFEYEPHDKYDIDVLHKNKTFLIVPKAIAAYYFEGKDPEQFMREHDNIYDFCGYARARGQWYFVQLWTDNTGIHEKEIQKTLRYYVSNTGAKVVKRKDDKKQKLDEETNKMVEVEIERQTQVLAGRFHITEFNEYVEKPMEAYDINYNFYMREIRKEIILLQKPQLKADLFFDEV